MPCKIFSIAGRLTHLVIFLRVICLVGPHKSSEGGVLGPSQKQLLGPRYRLIFVYLQPKRLKTHVSLRNVLNNQC